MANLVAANDFRVLAYLCVAGLAIAARYRERRRASEADGVWAPFWLLTAGLLAALAIGRLGDIGGLLAAMGREQAASSGWYASRRQYQAAVVIGVVALWTVTVVVAIWRVPERRRRYLPMSIAAITLVAYAAVRLVSLHHVDTLLYRTNLGGVQVSAVIELTLIAIAAGVSAWVPPAFDNSVPATAPLSAARYDASRSTAR